jgi:hypothetical protein
VRTVAACLVLIVGACSSRPGAPPKPPTGSAAPLDAPAPSANGPSERECDELFAHAIAIKIADQRQRLPPAQVPTEAEQAALRGPFVADCRAGTRTDQQCGIAAQTLAELDACQPRK